MSNDHNHCNSVMCIPCISTLHTYIYDMKYKQYKVYTGGLTS